MVRPILLEPLNWPLYSAPCRAFGDVDIRRAGKRMKVNYEGKRTIISEYGEGYAFDCPLCGDHDKQFLISYTFLVESEQVGRTKWIPLHCFAHGCHIKRSAQRKIERLVKSAAYREHYWLPKSRPPSPFSSR